MRKTVVFLLVVAGIFAYSFLGWGCGVHCRHHSGGWLLIAVAALFCLFYKRTPNKDRES